MHIYVHLRGLFIERGPLNACYQRRCEHSFTHNFLLFFLKQRKRQSFPKVSLKILASTLLHFLHNTVNKKQVCQQEKDQLHGVQVRVMKRRGQVLRKEVMLETVNEWLLETLSGQCVEMLTRP